MSLYENEICPVCGELFKDGDDIVTCPKCGTPHHRECYNSLGRCANADKHAGGYSYTHSPSAENNAEKGGESEHERRFAFNPNNSYYSAENSYIILV